MYTNLRIQNPITEAEKDLLEKIRQDVVGGPSIVFTRKAVVDETFILRPTSLCESIVGINASHLYTYSISQPLPTGIYALWALDPETSWFASPQNKTHGFESMVTSYFQQKRPQWKTEIFYTTRIQKKMTVSMLMGFFLIATLCLRPWVAFITFVPVRKYNHCSLMRICHVIVRREISDI